LDYGGHHFFMCTAHSASKISNGCTCELLALFTATQLRTHSSENKILIWYHIVWILVVIFSRSCNKRSNVRLRCFPIDKKMRKEWEDACGWMRLPKDSLIFSLHFSPDAFEYFSRPQLLKERTNSWDKKR